MFQATNCCKGVELTGWVPSASGFSQVCLPAVKAEPVWRGLWQVAAGVIGRRYFCTSLVSRCSANWGLSGVSGETTWGLCCVDILRWSCLLGLRKQGSNFSGSLSSSRSGSASWISYRSPFFFFIASCLTLLKPLSSILLGNCSFGGKTTGCCVWLCEFDFFLFSLTYETTKKRKTKLTCPHKVPTCTCSSGCIRFHTLFCETTVKICKDEITHFLKFTAIKWTMINNLA